MSEREERRAKKERQLAKSSSLSLVVSNTTPKSIPLMKIMSCHLTRTSATAEVKVVVV